jgi:hypothetical protein
MAKRSAGGIHMVNFIQGSSHITNSTIMGIPFADPVPNSYHESVNYLQMDG